MGLKITACTFSTPTTAGPAKLVVLRRHMPDDTRFQRNTTLSSRPLARVRSVAETTAGDFCPPSKPTKVRCPERHCSSLWGGSRRLSRGRALHGSGSPQATGVAAGAFGYSVPQAVAVFVGYLVIAGSFMVKVPQIIRVLKNKSASGISILGHINETLVYTVVFAYNVRNGYPFSSYGDIVACWVQNVVLALLISEIRGYSRIWIAAVASPFIWFCWYLMNPHGCSMGVLSALQAATIAVMVLGARIPQIWMNFRRGNSGELSMLTYALQWSGNLARIFTTLVLTKDPMLLASWIVLSVCNLVILVQVYATWCSRKAAARMDYMNGAGAAET